MRAVISRGLYFFNPFFTVAAANTADNLCTKQGNVGLESAAYKQERLMMARVRYIGFAKDCMYPKSIL